MNSSTTPHITGNFDSVNFNDLDGVPEGIPEKAPENSHQDHPYMGNLTSHQIGMMAKSGQLGGEMVKRMITHVEEEMSQGNDQLT